MTELPHEYRQLAHHRSSTGSTSPPHPFCLSADGGTKRLTFPLNNDANLIFGDAGLSMVVEVIG